MVVIDTELFNIGCLQDEFYQFLAKLKKLCKDYQEASMYVADLPGFNILVL